MQEIRVKAIDKKLDPLRFTGDWVDVRISSVMYLDAVRSPEQFTERAIESQLKYSRQSLQTTQVISIPAGHSIKVAHGFALELPKGYEAILHPRSSLFKKTGLVFVSSGVIDEGYNGDNDEWFSVWYATKDTDLYYDQRIAQFRIQEKQPKLKFDYVDTLGNDDRGGHGSTGDF
jgi:dUTP pyrophosphatase